MNQERLDVHVEFRKARGTKDQKDQVASIHWVIEKSRDFKIKKKKNSTSASLTMLCRSQQTVENSQRDGNTRTPYLSSKKSLCKTRSNG